MKKAIIYARVSSTNERQNNERQIKSLNEYASLNGYEVKEIFAEHISGAKRNEARQALNECIDYAIINKAEILISELSRMGRAIWEILETVKRCADNGVNVTFHKEGLSLMDENGKVNSIMAIYISCLSFCAEKERENIYFRLNQGREVAKAKGIKMGRKVGSLKSHDKKAVEYSNVIKQLKKGQSVRNTAKLCTVSVSTVVRLKKEFAL